MQFCDCDAPSGLTHEYVDSTSVVLRWDGHGQDSFRVDYLTYNPPLGSGILTNYPFYLSDPNANIQTLYTDADSVLITGLPRIHLSTIMSMVFVIVYLCVEFWVTHLANIFSHRTLLLPLMRIPYMFLGILLPMLIGICRVT